MPVAAERTRREGFRLLRQSLARRLFLLLGPCPPRLSTAPPVKPISDRRGVDAANLEDCTPEAIDAPGPSRIRNLAAPTALIFIRSGTERPCGASRRQRMLCNCRRRAGKRE